MTVCFGIKTVIVEKFITARFAISNTNKRDETKYHVAHHNQPCCQWKWFTVLLNFSYPDHTSMITPLPASLIFCLHNKETRGGRESWSNG